MKIFALITAGILTLTASAQTVQWASQLIAFSSEYTGNLPANTTRYKASQVLGVPNTLTYGISELAWAPDKSQSGKEYIVVGFDKPQYVQQVIIGETYNPGAVKEIILYDEKSNGHSVYENKNTTITNHFGQVLISYKIAPTTYKVKNLKLVLQTSNVGGMQQIDCIGISSTPAPVKLTIHELQYSSPVSNPENLGPGINSAFFDHLPLIAPDGSALFFTRKFAEGNTGAEQKDDIYFAYRMPDGSFSKGQNIGPPLNTNEHNFVCYIGADNNTLYLGNKYKGGNLAGISVSKRQPNGSWGKPASLNIPGLYNDNEFAHYHMSLDERTALMCVQRSDSYGDLDIYVAFKYADGTWSSPKNLGPVINTVGAEGSVFLAADGKTLYFSSSGHQGYGSYDMFMSKRLDNSWTNWSKPLNLGPRINSTEMDIYYTIPAAGDYAYFSSGRTMYGLNDLYRIKLPQEIRPEPVNLQQYQASQPIKQPAPQTPANNYPTVDPKITQPATTTATTKPVVPATAPADDLQEKLNALKQQQKQLSDPSAVKPATTTNTSSTTYKTQYVDPKPVPMPTDNTPKKPLFENLGAVENTDPNKPLYDKLATQQPQPVPAATMPNTAYIAPTPQVMIETTGTPIYSAPSSESPVISAPQPALNDPLMDKLEALKKQQQELKNTPVSTSAPTTQTYTSPAATSAYPYPAPPTNSYPDPQTQAIQQKLYDVQPQPVYPTEGVKLPPTDPYQQAWEKPVLKEKQPDHSVQEFSDLQDQINALKQQQQQQTFHGEGPKASKIKADTSDPNIKYIPPANTQTASAPNSADIQKFEERLKKVQDQLAALDKIPEPTATVPVNTAPQPEKKTETIVVTETEPKKSDPEAVTQQIPGSPEQIDNTINALNDSKQGLEKDIEDLSQQRDKISADKNKLASDNEQLAAERIKLETEKQQMDSLLAHMQAEKKKLEIEKAKLDALKKQQEKEIFALKSSIDSLKQVEAVAADNAAQNTRYELFNVPIEVGAVAVMSNIYFIADAAYIQKQSYSELDKLVAFMKQNHTLKVEIGGHTNGLCDDIFCNKLSNDRAKAIVDYLVSKGIDMKKLSYKGYGRQHLIAQPGDAVNQRVEIKILSLQ